MLALILNGKLTVANVGDSSAILVRNQQMLELTSEQVPSRIDEYQRIVSQQGVIVPVGHAMRVQGVLSVSRAIGDLHYKQFLTSEPEISSIQICPQDNLLVLATDGIFKTYEKSFVT